MKSIGIALFVLLTAGCLNMSMDREPDRWVQVLDIDTGLPVPDLPLVYTQVKKPYWIVGAVMVSREYRTDAAGRANVPSGVLLRPAPGAAFVIAMDRMKGKSERDLRQAETIHVRAYDRHMEMMRTPNRLPVN